MRHNLPHNLRHRQRGVTFIGWVVLLVPVAVIVYAGILIVPKYLNYMRVAKSLTQLASESSGSSLNAESLRNSLAKHFDIESIDHPKLSDIDIHRDGEHWDAIADYEDVLPMFGNLSLLLTWHKEVDIGKESGTGEGR